MTASVFFFVLVCGIATLNSVLLAALLCFHRKGDAVLNRLLAALLLAFAVRVCKTVVVFFVSGVHPLFEIAWMAVLALTGPVALLYLCRFVGAADQIRALMVRACGFGAVAAVLVFLLLPLGTGWKVMGGALSLYGSSIAVALPTVFGAARSDGPQGIPNRWARAITLFLTTIWVLYVALVASRLAGSAWPEEWFFNVEAAIFSLAVYALMYGEVKSGLLTRLRQPAGAAQIQADDPMLKRLRQAVEGERLYLDPALSLPSLAKTLRLTPQHVSRLINAGIGASFNDYVNRLRIEEIQRRLALPDGATRKIGQLGFDCGFSSSSVFYAAFRKFTGKTPSEYLKDVART